jgi:sec-independent protein translocase protein TatA
MFGLGPQELVLILIIVLVLFGAKRLPEIGGALGKSVREFKKATRKEHDEVSSRIGTGDESRGSSADTDSARDSGGGALQGLPGVKEARDIKETAGKIKAASRLFLKK